MNDKITVIRLPDVGEGIAEAEIAAWHVKPGDTLSEDQVFAEILTDKAAVEIPSSVSGEVLWIGGNVGDIVAVGAELLHVKTGAGVVDSDANKETGEEPAVADNSERVAKESEIVRQGPSGQTESRILAAETKPPVEFVPAIPAPAQHANPTPSLGAQKPLAAPSVRRRAREEGVDLNDVSGSGPDGRITHEDVQATTGGSPIQGPSANRKDNSTTDVKITGLRRKIAEHMVRSKRSIPHITIVEEIDVTELESLRNQLNADKDNDQTKLTPLAFIMSALVVAVREQPQMNAHYLEEEEILRQVSGVHIGIATQTERGLVVPVITHAQTLSLWQGAQRLTALSDAARDGTAKREDLSGSTITITSLGPLGAIATTPIINHPEVAIVGVNRMAIRPHYDGTAFVPRTMMNLSCSFDHRVVDGWDAAVFVRRLKTLLETPVLIFVSD